MSRIESSRAIDSRSLRTWAYTRVGKLSTMPPFVALNMCRWVWQPCRRDAITSAAVPMSCS